MSVRKLSVVLAGAALAVTPLAAHAAPVDRAAAPSAAENELGGNLLWIVIAIAVIVGAILLLDDDNDPVSP